MAVLDESDVVVFANEAMAKRTGVPIEQLIGIECSFLNESARHPLKESLAPPIDWDRATIRFEGTESKETRILLPLNVPSDGPIGAPLGVTAEDRSRVGASPSALLLIYLSQDVTDLIGAIDPIYRELLPDVPLPSASDASGVDGLDELWVTHGASLQTSRMRKQAAIACELSCSIAIVGEYCEERENLAKTIHRWHLQKKNKTLHPSSMIRVDCNLLDATLLDHVLEAIDESSVAYGDAMSVLLSRLDELSEELVVAIDRYVSQHPNIQFLVTTKDPLDGTTGKSESWERLWCRVSHHVVTIPDLRSRLEDLDALMNGWFKARRLSEEKGLRDFSKSIQTHLVISSSAKDALYAYPWPGSYSELSSSLEHAWNRAQGERIERSHLPIAVRTAPSHLSNHPSEMNGVEPIDLDQVLESIERQLIEEALASCQGNRSAAAKLLNVSRARLIRRLQQWGLASEGVSPSETPIVDDDPPMFEEINE